MRRTARQQLSVLFVMTIAFDGQNNGPKGEACGLQLVGIEYL